jgi:hypothetical protein
VVGVDVGVGVEDGGADGVEAGFLVLIWRWELDSESASELEVLLFVFSSLPFFSCVRRSV